MKLKRTVSFVLAMLLAVPMGICSLENTAYAFGTESVASASALEQGNGRCYDNQLPDEAKGFYDAMYSMYMAP